jgi:hypothetical protein
MFRPIWVILRCYQLYDTCYCITTRGRLISLIHQDPDLLLVCIYTLLGELALVEPLHYLHTVKIIIYTTISHTYATGCKQ